MKTHFFNPGYEASVDRNNRNYTPPKSVQAFRRDLATLPLYFKDSDDKVLIPEVLPGTLMHQDLVTEVTDNTTLAPWGWAPELFGLFGDSFVPYTSDEIKRFASRRLSLDLWQLIVKEAPELFSSYITPIELNGGEEAVNVALLQADKWVLKDEFSSSGRGVQFIQKSDLCDATFDKRRGAKRKTLFLEPYYDKVEDRGYEFYRSKEGEIDYIGVSCFLTEGGMYKGNYLAPPIELEDRLGAMPTTPSHDEYIRILTAALSKLELGDYEGYLGVDTLVTLDENNHQRIVPCLEINCRPTMGHLALSLGENWLPDGFVGYFTISHISSGQFSTPFVSRLPLYTFLEQPTKSGCYLLTPITNCSKFVAIMSVLQK